MHNLKNSNPIFLWGLSLALLCTMLSLPDSAFHFSILFPVVLCYLFPKRSLSIVLVATLLLGIFFSQNFFSVHLFSIDSNNPIQTLYGIDYISGWSNLEIKFLNIAGFVLYLLIFALIFKLHNLLFRRGSFAASVVLPLFILGLIWVSQIGVNSHNSLAYIFALSMLVMGRQAFYIFNYIRFFGQLPKTKSEFVSTIQPFWFLQFEIPENPRNPVSMGRDSFNKSLEETFSILFSIFICKVFLVIYITFFHYFVLGKFDIILNVSDFVSSFCINVFRNWRNENAPLLLSSLFTYSFTYLFGNFFIWGRVMIVIARLCGFQLPDYINQPWKSHSFADFFARMMHYYNIIIMNHFFYPVFDFLRRFNLSKKARIFISLNWALIWGGFFARLLKDSNKVYAVGFEKALLSTVKLALPYMVVLSLTITLSLLFRKKPVVKEKTNIPRMILYFLLYSLVASLNFSHLFGNTKDFFWFYVKIFSFGFIN